jgi:RNA polymerase sigma-70 factor (ECF subfamily)
MKMMYVNTMLQKKTKLINRQDLIEIYKQHSPELFRYAVRLLNDQELAEDCVSETFSRFLRVVQKEGDPIENVRAYLYRVAHNWITDHYRRQPLTPLALNDDIKDGPKSNPSLMAVREIEEEQVRKALLKLPADQQQVIHLRFLEDWSYPAIADMLGKSVEATRALQYRALVSLRQMLSKQDNEVHYE